MSKENKGAAADRRQERATVRRTVGVYDRPRRSALGRETMVAIAAIVALVAFFMIYQLLQGP